MPREMRIIYTDAVHRAREVMFPADDGKVFAIVGPFDGHMDKLDLQHALAKLLREWNAKN